MTAKFSGNVVDNSGNVQGAATVTVKDENGALIPAAQLFSDAAHTVPFASNPFTTDAQGSMDFYIEPQTVNITAQKGAFLEQRDNVILNSLVNTSTFATAAQGALADSALQAADITTKADLVSGVIPNAQLPSLAISEFLGASTNEAAMLALSGERGDWTTRSDTSTTWVISNDGGSSLSDWTELSTPASPVSSVNGNTGAVVLSASDVGAATAAQGALADSAMQASDIFETGGGGTSGTWTKWLDGTLTIDGIFYTGPITMANHGALSSGQLILALPAGCPNSVINWVVLGGGNSNIGHGWVAPDSVKSITSLVFRYHTAALGPITVTNLALSARGRWY